MDKPPWEPPLPCPCLPGSEPGRGEAHTAGHTLTQRWGWAVCTARLGLSLAGSGHHLFRRVKLFCAPETQSSFQS